MTKDAKLQAKLCTSYESDSKRQYNTMQQTQDSHFLKTNELPHSNHDTVYTRQMVLLTEIERAQLAELNHTSQPDDQKTQT